MMYKMRLTTFVIAIKNLRKRSFRTKGLIAIVAVLAFTIFCGALLSESLSLGKNYLSGRMGADIMVVPRGYALEFQNTLLRSESNTFYMKQNIADKILEMPAIEKVSPQLLIGSLNASCCTVPVQLIGFDPKTDFTIKSWMTKIDSSKLGFGEVVIGSRVNAEVGSDIWLFGQPLKVEATLDDTGMGFDSSVFMTIDTAKRMIETSTEVAVHPAGTGKEQVSALFIKLTSDSEVTGASKTIISEYPQTDIVILNDMMKHVRDQVNNIKGLAYGIQGLLWIVSILILTVIYTFTANERKREFGLLLVLGATRKKLESLLMTETMIISLLGALLGVIAASLIMFEFRMLIAISLGIPYIQPTIDLTIKLAAMSILISVLTGLIACIYSLKRIENLETHIMIREYE
jgi:putative ABC transport system permease protein